MNVEKLTGTLLWYWAICRREAWLLGHALTPNEDDPYLELGRFLSQYAYPKAQRRELSLPGIKIDLIGFEREGVEEVVAVEIKKSSRFLEAARLQVLFYLHRLEEEGIVAYGELRIPKERKRFPVKLDAKSRLQLQQAIADLEQLLEENLPPPPKRIHFCRRCAYREFCWAEMAGNMEGDSH